MVPSGFAGKAGHLRIIAPIRAASRALETCCIEFFPRLHHEMRGNFFRCQGGGLHDVAMGDQRSAPTRAADGIAPIRAAQGILWLGRHALQVRCAVMESRVARRRPQCRYFDTVWAGVGQCHIIGPVTAAESPQLSRNSARQIGK
jgi:hypothetical protein